MSTGEVLLTMLVAFVVFGPSKLPMLARHIGLLLARFNRYKQLAVNVWQRQLSELQLEENIRKAKAVNSNDEKSM